MTVVSVYDEAQKIVAQLTDAQRDAVLAALFEVADRDHPGWDLVHPRLAAPVVKPRHRVGLLEAIRGVDCCDVSVRKWWRSWQRSVVWIAVVMLFTFPYAVLFGGVLVWCGLSAAAVLSTHASWRLGPLRC